MVWKKRNKTGGLQSRNRPMRNHEMVYFFYEQAPKYNRDKYHKRIQAKKEHNIEKEGITMGRTSDKGAPFGLKYDPPNPASVLEEKKSIYGCNPEARHGKKAFDPPNPASVFVGEAIEKDTEGQKKAKVWGYEKCTKSFDDNEKVNGGRRMGANYEPPNPVSVVEAIEFIEPAEDEPKSMFESTKVFIGKRHHQTEKPQDILEFFLY